jgi:hypothetical protein
MRHMTLAPWVAVALVAAASPAWAAHSADVDLQTVQRYPDAGSAQSIAVGDLDSDGLLDAAVASGGTPPTVRLYRQQVDHTLVPQTVPLPSEAFYDGEPEVAVVDLDADGRLELLAGVERMVYVYGQAADGLQIQQTFDLGDVYQVADLVVADWDGDGDHDVFTPVFRTEESTDGPRWLRNDGGRLSVQDPGLDADTAGTVKSVVDVDGDGQVELVGWQWELGSSARVRVHSRDASGAWQSRLYDSGRGLSWISELAVADVTGDGRVDIVATTDGEQRPTRYAVEVFSQQADKSFGVSTVHASWENTDAVVVGDMNGDGRRDVVVNHQGYDAVGVYQQKADGGLEPERRFSLYPRSGSHDLRTGLQVADVDADGHLDVLIATDNHGLQVIRQGPAPEPGSAGPPPPSEPPSSGPTARSIDGACPDGRVPESEFSDVAVGSAHERAIDCVVWWEVARGRTATTYAPADGVTREAMASFVARAILEAQPGALPEEPADAFTDDDASIHEKAIDQLAAVGIVEGTGERRYDPGTVLNRGQMAKFLSNAAQHVLGEALPADEDLFDDDDGTRFESDINRVAQAGLTGGRPDGTYGPAGPVQRDQMASFLARALDLFVDDGADLPS